MAKVTFNKSGSGSETGRLIIPALMLKILDIKDSKEDTDRRISISFVDNKVVGAEKLLSLLICYKD